MTSSFAGYRLRQRPPASGRALPAEPSEFLQQYIQSAEAAIAKPFVGVTADGAPAPDLFALRPTGVSTRPIMDEAAAFLTALTPEQRQRASFSIESDAWRRWSNIHVFTMRHGVSLDELDRTQRDRALALVASSLSRAGFSTARDVMKLNETIREITGRSDEYGEWLYWVSIMGTPSLDAPWGWQIDGHHLIINCLVLGEQVVMTPMFMGSEPVVAETGVYAGTRVFADEEQRGLALMRTLSGDQRTAAIIATELPGEVFTTAFRDNLELGYAGIPFTNLTEAQQDRLLALIETYTGRIAAGHAQVTLDEVREQIASTYFAWIGGYEESSVFYYRIHSPVILIEFDHQRGVALDSDQPTRDHIHTVVRTPNGNDYGRDLLRRHYERVSHRPAAVH